MQPNHTAESASTKRSESVSVSTDAQTRVQSQPIRGAWATRRSTVTESPRSVAA